MQKPFGPKNFSSQPTTTKGGDFTKQEVGLAKREGILEERERQLEQKQRSLDEKLNQLEILRKELIEKTQMASGMSPDEAKKILLEQLDKDLALEMSKKIRQAEDEAKLQIDEKVRELLADAMLHGVTDYISEFTTSKVKLDDKEMKGRIIGKEGRNIRTFEQVTGVEVVMDDDMPDTLIISSFDPVRREIAKVALEKLIADGRIQPQRIEEVVDYTKQDIEKIMCQAGEKLCADIGVYNMPSEIICLLGRFKYRYSYGQNMIQHTLEETKIGIELAKQIGADVNVVRLGCLLHDVGKILTDWEEGTHVERGVQLAKKFSLPEKVVNCIAEHHEDKSFSSVESIIVYIADAISGGRPGARHEDVKDYIKRMDDIEKIATSFAGVDKAFAVAAGREVRVIVISEKVSDLEMPKLVHDIAARISKEVMVPGAVKITAVRETRVTETTMTPFS